RINPFPARFCFRPIADLLRTIQKRVKDKGPLCPRHVVIGIISVSRIYIAEAKPDSPVVKPNLDAPDRIGFEGSDLSRHRAGKYFDRLGLRGHGGNEDAHRVVDSHPDRVSHDVSLQLPGFLSFDVYRMTIIDLNLSDLAKRSFCNHPRESSLHRIKMENIIDHSNLRSIASFQLNLPSEILKTCGTGLFTKKVLAGFKCNDRLRPVKSIGRADEDGIDIVPFRHLSKIGLIPISRQAEFRKSRTGTLRIAFTECENFRIVSLHDTTQQSFAHPSSTSEPDCNFLQD